jgi:hypothetical protein
MKPETIEKIEKAISILEEARSEISSDERFYTKYYAKITLYDYILQLQNYVQDAEDTNKGLTVIDVLKRKVNL